MSIGGALSNAVSGMSAASRRAEVTSNNIANASTEGYATQRVLSSHNIVHGRGAGVRIEATERVTDPRLTASRRSAEADAGADAAQAEAARGIADLFDGPSSLFNRISALETNLRAVSEAPESGALQERAVTAAGDIATTFRDVSDSLGTIRAQADADIASSVSDVNAALKEIEELNGEISYARVGNRSAASLEQARDDQLDIIAQHIPIRTMSRDNGQIAILTDSGVTMLDGKAKELSFTHSPIVTAGMDYRNGNGPLSGLSINGIDLTPGGGNQSLSGGKISGLFEARDGIAVDALAQVDALAADLVGRFEASGIAGADGRGLFTDAGAASDPANIQGLAGRIALNERVDPANGGEVWRIRDGLDAATQGPVAATAQVNALLDAMTATRAATGALSTPDSAAGFAAALGSIFEQRGQGLEDSAATSQGRLLSLEDAESSVIGVDIDRELQNLILIEQAYAANARVIEVADRLVQRLLEI